MIKVEHLETYGWEAAIRGMRNPLNSWEKMDSGWTDEWSENSDQIIIESDWEGWQAFVIGPNDQELMKKLAAGGSTHAKYRRMINITMDITAPLYWWKEFDTYKVGTVANSCSTMHKIAAKEFTLEDFSCEHLIKLFDYATEDENGDYTSEYMDKYCLLDSDEVDGLECTYLGGKIVPIYILDWTIAMLNRARDLYLKTNDKRYWWQMIQLLPSSYNQKRTIQMNYEVAAHIYHDRKDHKLDEWRELCQIFKDELPLSELVTGEETE